MKGFLVRLRAILRAGVADRELDEEMRFHIELETEKNIALGMTPDEARRRGLADFGGVLRRRDEHRDVRGARWIGESVGDARYALRTLRRSPALAIAAVLTLALAVGANTAIYTAVNAVMLRPLPFPAPERLVMLWEENPEKGWHMQVDAPANVLDWREQVAAFQDVAAYWGSVGRTTLAGEGAPQVLRRAGVTGNFFAVFGARAAVGRTLRDEETWDTGAPVVVLSHRLWRERFGGDPAVVGRTIRLDGRGVTVVGVMDQGFEFPFENIDVWVPTAWNRADRAKPWFRRAHWLRAVARLKPGVSIDQANAELQQVVDRLKHQYPETNKLMGAGMTPLHTFLVGDTRMPLLVLLGAVGLLLLIACANVGNLLLVHAAGREREVALRLALGAGRARLVRQALTESIVLSAMGGAAGLALGWSGTRALGALQPEGMLRVREFGVDWSVLAYVIAITTASGLLFGIAPAVWNARRLPADALREGGRTESGGRRMRRWGDTLVIGEVALTLLLTVGAGLLVRSFWELQRVDAGFDASNVLTVPVVLSDDVHYDTGDKAQAFYEAILSRVRGLPGVDGAALVSPLPLTGRGYTSDFTAAGRAREGYGTEIVHRQVTPDYFRTMRVRLLSGRAFSPQDRNDAPRVVIINDALARSYFRGQAPVGQRITFDKLPDSTSRWWTIVGVVRSEHQQTLAIEPQIEAYVPFTQERQGDMTLVVRTRGEPLALAPAVRRAVAELDPTLAVEGVRTMEEVRAASLARERFLMTLLLSFAGVGLLLAVVGVYGVLAHLARQRTREMGIRIALGAQGTQVRWLVVRHGLRLVAVGLAFGGTAALLATQAMRGLLFNVPPADPLTYASVALLLAATGVVASWLPALRASRADPVVALRGE